MLHLPWTEIWSEEELYKLQVNAVTEFMKYKTRAAVEAAIEFAKYLSYRGLISDNYPIFLEMMRRENHHIVDALIGDEDSFDLFTEIQPNYYIVNFCFEMLYAYPPGRLYEKTLAVVFGIIYRNYHSTKEGYRLYPLTLENLNSVGKFLDKSKGQSDKTNRFILDILADIAEYRTTEGDENVNKISAHAVAIRNAFFDRRLKLESVMPKEILVKEDYRASTVNPRKTRPFKKERVGAN